MISLAEPDAVDGRGQIRTRMPFQKLAKLVHRHVTIATHGPGLALSGKRNVQELASFVQVAGCRLEGR
jgi:hypothetical protein